MYTFKSTIRERLVESNFLSVFEHMNKKNLNWNAIKHTTTGELLVPTVQLEFDRRRPSPNTSTTPKSHKKKK